MDTPICGRCKKNLEKLDISRGAMTFGGSIPTLYKGVICTKCHKIECTDCKGYKLDAPCSWCGENVSPAYDYLLK